MARLRRISDRNLATGTLLAIYRQAARLAPSVALRNGFFTD